MTVYILRGSHANEYELQNYYPLAKKFNLQVVTTHRLLTPLKIPTIKVWSPADIPQFPYKRQIFNRLIGGEQWLVGLDKLVTKGSIIHTAETYTPYTHQAVLLKKKGIITKLICTCWETIPHNNEKFARLRRWKNDAYQYVDLFHTPTKKAKQALVAEGVPPSKIIVIPYGVDTKRFKPRQRKPNNKPVILTVARLVPEKGMAKIAKAARLLPDCDFHVVGEGSYQFYSDNIKTYSVPYSRIHQIYQQADIFFFPTLSTPTWEEQYGMALIEARACGLSVVAGDSGAIGEVLSLPKVVSATNVASKLAHLYA